MVERGVRKYKWRGFSEDMGGVYDMNEQMDGHASGIYR